MLYHITNASSSYHIIYLLCSLHIRTKFVRLLTVARSNNIQSEQFVTNINLSRIADTATIQGYKLRKKIVWKKLWQQMKDIIL